MSTLGRDILSTYQHSTMSDFCPGAACHIIVIPSRYQGIQHSARTINMFLGEKHWKRAQSDIIVGYMDAESH